MIHHQDTKTPRMRRIDSPLRASAGDPHFPAFPHKRIKVRRKAGIRSQETEGSRGLRAGQIFLLCRVHRGGFSRRGAEEKKQETAESFALRIQPFQLSAFLLCCPCAGRRTEARHSCRAGGSRNDCPSFDPALASAKRRWLFPLTPFQLSAFVFLRPRSSMTD